MAKCLFVLFFFSILLFLFFVSDHIFVFSNQKSDLAGHMSFEKKKNICSPAFLIHNSLRFR